MRTMQTGNLPRNPARATPVLALAALGALLAVAGAADAQASLDATGTLQGALHGGLEIPDVPRDVSLDGAASVTGAIDLETPEPETPEAPDARGYLDAFVSFGANAAVQVKGAAEAMVDGIADLFHALTSFASETSAQAEAEANAEARATEEGLRSTVDGLQSDTHARVDAHVDLRAPDVEVPETPAIAIDGSLTGTVRGFLG